MKKQENIDIVKITTTPYNLTPSGLLKLKKILIEKKRLLTEHKSWIIQLNVDIEELEEILNNAGVKKEMLEKWEK